MATRDGRSLRRRHTGRAGAQQTRSPCRPIPLAPMPTRAASPCRCSSRPSLPSRDSGRPPEQIWSAGQPAADALDGVETTTLGEATVAELPPAPAAVTLELLTLTAGQRIPAYPGPTLVCVDEGAIGTNIVAGEAQISRGGRPATGEPGGDADGESEGDAIVFPAGMAASPPLGGDGRLVVIRLGDRSGGLRRRRDAGRLIPNAGTGDPARWGSTAIRTVSLPRTRRRGDRLVGDTGAISRRAQVVVGGVPGERAVIQARTRQTAAATGAQVRQVRLVRDGKPAAESRTEPGRTSNAPHPIPAPCRTASRRPADAGPRWRTGSGSAGQTPRSASPGRSAARTRLSRTPRRSNCSGGVPSAVISSDSSPSIRARCSVSVCQRLVCWAGSSARWKSRSVQA